MTQDLLNKLYTKLLPIVGEKFNEAPLYFSLDENSEYAPLFVDKTHSEVQKSLDELIASKGKNWSISGYLENRAAIVKSFSQMLAERRFFHLGVDLNLPCGANLYAPFDCVVEFSGFEDGEGNYGGNTLLKCKNSETEFYMVFGHLDSATLHAKGTLLKKGDVFGQIGDEGQNGNWFYHTHMQILTPLAYEKGWLSKGYCNENDLQTIKDFCPDPFSFL